ncbi:MAG: DUF4340 domain-containing protein [Rhodothermus sp.]|nr:DUF4340 domain-containing protein [Rhodothermus sp.]
MPRKNPVVILSAVLVVLLVLAWATGAFKRNPSTIDVPAWTLRADEIIRIRLERPEKDPLTLERGGSGWQLTAPIRYPADSSFARRFVENLAETELVSVVSINPARYGTYGVADSNAIRLVAYRRAGDSLQLFWGNPGPDFQARYVRLAGDERVFLARTGLTFPEDLSRWRDKTILNVPAAQVEALEVQHQGQTYGVRRSESGWELVENNRTVAADSAAAVRWAGQFDPLRADGFFDELSADSIRQAPDYVLTLRLPGGVQQVLYFDERDNGWAVVRGDDDTVFRIYAYRRSQLLPSAGSLRARSNA